jgi:hypothetical protein
MGRLAGAVLRHGALIAFFGVVACLYTFPLAARLGTHFPVWADTVMTPGADQLLTSWILATDVRTLLEDPLRIWESNNFHPFRRTLTWSENLLGLAIPLIPVQLIGQNPVFTNNAATLLSLALTGWGVHLLVRELSGSPLAGLLTGVLLVYTPSKWSDLSQLHMVASHWTPIALFAWVRVIRTGSWRWAAALGAAAAAQAWTSLHWGLFLALALASATPIALVTSREARRALPQLAGGAALAAALCAPLVVSYRTFSWYWDIQRRGTMPAFFWPPQAIPPYDRPLSHLWERLLSGRRVQSLSTLTPWFAIVAGAAAGLVARRPRVVDWRLLAALVGSGILAFLLSLGPIGLFGLPSVYYLFVDYVPGFGVVRAPVRAANYTYLVLCIGAGCGLGAVLRRLRSRAAHVAIALVVCVLAVAEAGWRIVILARAPTFTTPISAEIDALPPDCALLELPAYFETGALALFRSAKHWRPIINGYSGFYGIEPWISYHLVNPFPGASSLRYLWEFDGCAVVVRWPERYEEIKKHCAKMRLDVREAGNELLVRVPPAPPERPVGAAIDRSGWRAEGSASAVLDGDLETLWTGSTLTMPQFDRLVVDLGEARDVGTVELALGHHLRSYLVSYRVEGSVDGASWKTLAQDRLAIPPVRSYRADPMRVRQRIPLRSFGPIRHLRIGPHHRPPQQGVFPDVGWKSWGVAELHAFAPVEPPPNAPPAGMTPVPAPSGGVPAVTAPTSVPAP